MRLDKYLSKGLNISRTDAKKIIKSNLVRVESITKPKADLIVKGQTVLYKNEPVVLPGNVYILLNKPSGYICSTQDEVYPSALKLVDSINCNQLHFAGRLDVDTTGLVLISNDGEWTHRITSPRKKCSKQYNVELADPVSDESIKSLENGILLKGESKATRKCVIQRLADSRVLIEISEGKYHQVKRMFAAVGNRVTALQRIKVGGLDLSELEVGEWRYLEKDEVKSFE
ncbi:pseudouridine synthase [Aliikangiella sp. G2MR2-5]|uniref:pseudouridine synthase n=1 Tax=Aliikangiella sp. G2MR2-5 TaxID=2788943 RepID=UPI0018A9F37B|nr:pseudouridine synthase [Aliikangiella sp. G2MR2-5]